MVPDVSGPDAADALAVLCHPHPDYGGDRFHPLVDRLFRRLPEVGVGAVRFDFSSGEPTAARDDVLAAVAAGAVRWPARPVVLVGYSFGAGVAATVDDAQVVGWFLVAPQTTPLAASSLGRDPRPKALVVPGHDQYAPPDQVEAVTADWVATTLDTVPGDHFLGASLEGVVDACVAWVVATARA